MGNTCTFQIDAEFPPIITLYAPHTISYRDSRNIVRFHFWTGSSYTGDISKAAETITLAGSEYLDIEGALLLMIHIHNLDDAVDRGDELTLSYLGDVLLDTIWVTRNFTFVKEGRYEYSWSLTLEKK